MTGDEIEIGEATLAVVGMTKVLTGEMPRIGVGVQKEIIGLGAKIDGLARQFVYDELPKKLSVPRPFTYRKLVDQFTKPIPAGTIADLVSKFPRDAHDIGLSFMSTLQAAYGHLAEIVPVADYNTYLGPKRIMPTSDKLIEFYLKYWVIDDPLVAFKLMQSGALLPDQVSTLLEFYPSIHNYMKAAILNALVARNLREPNFMNLPPRADRGLATFKQQRIVPYGVNIHAIEPPQQKPAAAPATAKISPALQTTGQKAASL